MKITSLYEVSLVTQQMTIDGDWFKPQWQKIKPVEIVNYMGSIPGFQPTAKAKMMYDQENLYVIFQVKDCFIRCVTKDINGPVWEDSCVEFFFSPDNHFPERYFNLEINCGGTPLMHYNTLPGNQFKIIDPDEISKIEIAHSLPQIIDPEIIYPVTWTVEYRIPVGMLNKYSPVTYPEPGIEWRANFYKIAENNSNPHYMSWSPVQHDQPDFHLPQFFGMLKFQ